MGDGEEGEERREPLLLARGISRRLLFFPFFRLETNCKKRTQREQFWSIQKQKRETQARARDYNPPLEK